MKKIQILCAVALAMIASGVTPARADFSGDLARRAADVHSADVALPGLVRVQSMDDLDFSQPLTLADREQILGSVTSVYSSAEAKAYLPKMVEEFWNREGAPSNVFFFLGAQAGAFLGGESNIVLVVAKEKGTGKTAYFPGVILRLRLITLGGDLHFGAGYLKDTSSWANWGVSAGIALFAGAGAGMGMGYENGQFSGTNAVWAELKLGTSVEFGPYVEFFPVLK